jgi:hypothetical protein
LPLELKLHYHDKQKRGQKYLGYWWNDPNRGWCRNDISSDITIAIGGFGASWFGFGASNRILDVEKNRTLKSYKLLQTNFLIESFDHLSGFGNTMYSRNSYAYLFNFANQSECTTKSIPK